MSTVTVDKLAYVEKLKALRESVATKADLRELELSLKLWTASLAGVLLAALSAIKFFGR